MQNLKILFKNEVQAMYLMAQFFNYFQFMTTIRSENEKISFLILKSQKTRHFQRENLQRVN